MQKGLKNVRSFASVLSLDAYKSVECASLIDRDSRKAVKYREFFIRLNSDGLSVTNRERER